MLNKQVEEIAQVPGIDVLFIGPWDLGNNIGRPVLGAFHDDLNTAIDRIFKAAVDNGKRVGIYCTGGEAAKKYADQGFHMVRLPLLFFCPGIRFAYITDFRRCRCCRPPDVPFQFIASRQGHLVSLDTSIQYRNQHRMYLLLVCLIHQRFHLLFRKPMEQLLRIRQSFFLLARSRLHM